MMRVAIFKLLSIHLAGEPMAEPKEEVVVVGSVEDELWEESRELAYVATTNRVVQQDWSASGEESSRATLAVHFQAYIEPHWIIKIKLWKAIR